MTSTSSQRKLGKWASAARWAAVGAALALAAPGSALAKYCSNPCATVDGALCASLTVVGSGPAPDQVLAQGQPVRVLVGRQSGSCGGLVALTAAELPQVQLVTAPQAAGPFTEVKADIERDALRFTPAAAGPLFLRVQPRGGDGRLADSLVALVTPARPAGAPEVRPEVRFKFTGVKRPEAAQALVSLRYHPPGDAEAAGFAARRWPQFRRNAAPGASEQPQRLPLGTFDVDWQSGAHRHSAQVQVGGPGTIEVAVPAK